MTELYFCNVCQQSVPQIKLDTGNAIRHGNRIICPDCADTLVKATELEPEKKEWIVSPVVLAFFVMTWGAFAYLYVDQQNFIAAMQDSQSAIKTKNNQLSSTLSGYKSSISSEIGAVAVAASHDREKIQSAVHDVDMTLRKAIANHASRLEKLDDLPVKLISLGDSLLTAKATISSIEESARVIREGQHVLRDKVSLLQRQSSQTAAPADAEELDVSSAAQSLIRDLSDSDPNVRFVALEKLVHHDDADLVSFVVPMLKDSYEFCRFQAATTLREWSSLAAVPHLVEALDDSFEFVRKEVNAALESITTDSVGFDHKATESELASQQQAWRDWLNNNGY